MFAALFARVISFGDATNNVENRRRFEPITILVPGPPSMGAFTISTLGRFDLDQTQTAAKNFTPSATEVAFEVSAGPEIDRAFDLDQTFDSAMFWLRFACILFEGGRKAAKFYREGFDLYGKVSGDHYRSGAACLLRLRRGRY